MPSYRITWTIDTEAESPREAAEYALNVQRDPESTATVFDVCNDDGTEPVRIDLDPQENPMSPEKLNSLKRQCASYLKANALKPASVRGRTAIHTFWFAAMCALDVPNDPYVTICLLSGRHTDLIAEPTHA